MSLPIDGYGSSSLFLLLYFGIFLLLQLLPAASDKFAVVYLAHGKKIEKIFFLICEGFLRNKKG